MINDEIINDLFHQSVLVNQNVQQNVVVLSNEMCYCYLQTIIQINGTNL